MPDETISESLPIGSRASRSSPSVAHAPMAADDIPELGLATGDGESAPSADELSVAFQATGVIDPGQSLGTDATGVLDATGPQRTDDRADFHLNPEVVSVPTGAFDPTRGGATGAFDPTEGATGAL